MGHFINRLIDLQTRWAKPFGDFNHRWLSALFRPIRPVKEFLHGRWLGTHPLHSAATDLPIGALTVAVVLEVIGQPGPAGIALSVGMLGMAASVVTGAADYTDTDGTARTKATVHATIMVVGVVALLGSVVARAGDGAGGAMAAILLVVGYLIVVSGAYVGGDVVFALGNMVDRHAWRGRGTKWVALDLGGATEIPDGVPSKAKAGPNALVLVRNGTTIHALHDQCAHAGGPLSEGRIVDGCIECPWHASRYRLADGVARGGPTLYDQPAYEVRPTESGTGYEVRRIVR